YVLSNKLRQFSYEEIEFFLPQLCHLVISIDNESMALEEFLLDLCEESVNGALLTFWLFQTYLHDLAPQPASNAFQTCRRVHNKVQRIVFGGGDPPKRERIHENVLPTTVLASLVLAGVGVPLLPQHAGPLAINQARRPRPIEDTLSETPTPVQKLGRSATVAGDPSSSRRWLSFAKSGHTKRTGPETSISTTSVVGIHAKQRRLCERGVFAGAKKGQHTVLCHTNITRCSSKAE
ncbi:hypothetical protein KC352_g43767, partial [Hortaea werneckii]